MGSLIQHEPTLQIHAIFAHHSGKRKRVTAAPAPDAICGGGRHELILERSFQVKAPRSDVHLFVWLQQSKSDSQQFQHADMATCALTLSTFCTARFKSFRLMHLD